MQQDHAALLFAEQIAQATGADQAAVEEILAEARAEEAFAERGGTLIVIAHRVSSALRARRVLVLDGVSATEGDHPELLATSALYRELLGHWEAGSVVSSIV